MPEMERPLGVTIIGILNILSGLFYLVGGLALGAILAIAIPLLGGIIGALLVIIGIIYIILGIGCFKGWGWVWTLTVIFSILGILISLVSLVVGNFTSIVSIIIAAIILWYLFQEEPKKFFGKA
jgi:hypothetical protein